MNDSQQPVHRHVLVYGLGAVVLQLTGVILLPLYTHFLSAAEYGVLQVVYRIGEVFNICLLTQAIKLTTFNLLGNATDEAQRNRAASSVAVVTWASLLLGVPLVLLVGGPLDRLLSINHPTFLVVGVLTLMLQATTVMPLGMMQARFESLPYVMTTVGITVTHVIVASLFVAVFRWGIWGVVASLALTYGTFGIVLSIREFTRSSFHPDPQQIRRFLHFAAPLVPAGLLAIAMHNGDQLFMMKSHGAAVVGVYALAYRITQALEAFTIEPLCQIWHPWIYKAFQREEGPSELGRAATRILSVYIFVGLGLVILRREAVSLLSSSDYSASIELIPMLVAAFFFMVACSLIDASFFLSNNNVRRMLISSVSAVIMLTLYFALIPPYAGYGAALATLIGFGANCFITLVIAQNTYRINYEYGRVALLAGTAIACAWVASGLGDSPVHIVAKCAIWLAWPLALWLTGVVTREEKQMLIAPLRKGWPLGLVYARRRQDDLR